MRRVGRSAAVAMVLCGLAAGCSDDDDTPSTTSSTGVVPGPPGPVAIGTFSLTGAIHAEGPFEIIYARDEEQFETCESIADPEAETFIVPVPTAIGEQRLVWQAALQEYDGPGVYELPRLEAVSAEVRATPDAVPVVYQSVDGSVATLEVAAGNAGTFTFTGLRSPEGAELSGSLEWSCSIR